MQGIGMVGTCPVIEEKHHRPVSYTLPFHNL